MGRDRGRSHRLRLFGIDLEFFPFDGLHCELDHDTLDSGLQILTGAMCYLAVSEEYRVRGSLSSFDFCRVFHSAGLHV